MKRVLRVVLACAAIAASASAAGAEVYGSLTSPPGVYFGAGNPNGNFNISRDATFELGLRAKNRGPGPVLIDGSSGIYSVAPGYCNPTCSGGPKASYNYEFSIHTTNNAPLSNYVFRLGVDHNPSAAANYFFVDPITYWTDNSKDLLLGVQGSQNVAFGDTPGGTFNVFTPGLYNFILLAYNPDDLVNALAQVDMTVQVVPEPQSLALFALGLASLAALRRRKASRP